MGQGSIPVDWLTTSFRSVGDRLAIKVFKSINNYLSTSASGILLALDANRDRVLTGRKGLALEQH